MITVNNYRELKRQRDALSRAVHVLFKAEKIVRKGMGGHDHYDSTEKDGLGCARCIVQRKARAEADRLIAVAEFYMAEVLDG